MWLAPNRRLMQLGRIAARASGNGHADTRPTEVVDAGERVAADQTKRAVSQSINALKQAVRDEPDAFGIRTTMVVAGKNLVDVLEALCTVGPEVVELSPTDAPDVRAAVFVQGFVERVVGVAATPAASAARQAAAYCGRMILETDPRFSRAVEYDASGGSVRLGSDVFCLIYTVFFERLLIEVITSVVAAKIAIWLPGLYLIDPGGMIAEWGAEQIVDALDPCQEQHQRGDGMPVAELARDLVEETVRRMLGLPNQGTENSDE
ncbi:hypothetical protein [Nocardia sp. CC216A]|uniref:hypothetical protein n=1 Tax=Nocardia sp. CC216A TaxID=3044158 RepID=UPI002795621C|nr:hypothetical protein [Nocardia sp. CC216A]